MLKTHPKPKLALGNKRIFITYIKFTTMKIKELKEMIKAAFVAEAKTNAQYFYEPMGEANAPINIVTTMDEKTIVGTHQYGVGFKSNEAGKKMGFKDNPTSIPNGTKMSEDDSLNEVDDIDFVANLEKELAEGEDKVVDPYIAEDLYEAEEEEEEIEDKAEEEVEDEGGEEKSDSIVVDKKIVSLSSLPNDTRKILDSLETLRAQAEEFGDQKFITQVGNTITFFTRDFVVAGDEPTKAKVDESLEILKMKKLAGLLTEGEYAKALLNETTTDNVSDWDEGLYIAINKKPSPEMQIQIAKEANKEFFVDMEKIKFGKNPNTGEYSVFIPFAGDYSNMMDVLEKFGIGKRPYTSPHLK